MQRKVPLPGSIHIESCGTIVSRGKVELVDPAIRGMTDAWSAYCRIGSGEKPHVLTYPGRSLHPPETVALCRQLAMSGQASRTTLVYVHRGHQGQSKTPLLQSLLAKLPPGLEVHGLRVEKDHLPLDVLLFAAATLKYSDRCIIVKDNAIRLGTTDVVSVSSTQLLVLCRSLGSWAIDEILVIDDDNTGSASYSPMYPLHVFLTDPHCEANSLRLVSRMTTGCLGIIRIRRVGPLSTLRQLPNFRPELMPSLGLPVLARAAMWSTIATSLLSTSTHGEIDHA